MNVYLEKIADDLSRDRYARQLGYEDPRMAAIRSGAMNAALTSGGVRGRGEYGVSDGIWTASHAAMGAAAAHEQAHSTNALIRSIIEAQDQAVRTGNSDAYNLVKHDLDEDPDANRLGGYAFGGITGGILGGMAGHHLGNGNLGGTLAGVGLGALGLGYGMGKGMEYLAHAHNDSNANILAARAAYIKAKGM